MKIHLKESELRQYIRETIAECNQVNNTLEESVKGALKEVLAEGEWLDSAKALGKAGLNFGKATGKKIRQGAQWLNDKAEQAGDWIDKKWDEFEGGDKGRAESRFLFAIKDRNQGSDIHLIRDYENSIEKLKQRFPSAWLWACNKEGYNPNED